MRLPLHEYCSSQGTSPRPPARRTAALAVSLLTAVISMAPPGSEATGQEGVAQGKVSGGRRPGQIYLTAVGQDDVLRGVVAIDPNDGTWRRIAEEVHQQARVSPDGRRLAVRRFSRGRPDPGLWVYDTTGEKDP